MLVLQQELRGRNSDASKASLAKRHLPNYEVGRASFEGRAFCGRFSQDGSVFCGASQGAHSTMRLHSHCCWPNTLVRVVATLIFLRH